MTVIDPQFRDFAVRLHAARSMCNPAMQPERAEALEVLQRTMARLSERLADPSNQAARVSVLLALCDVAEEIGGIGAARQGCLFCPGVAAAAEPTGAEVEAAAEVTAPEACARERLADRFPDPHFGPSPGARCLSCGHGPSCKIGAQADQLIEVHRRALLPGAPLPGATATGGHRWSTDDVDGARVMPGPDLFAPPPATSIDGERDHAEGCPWSHLPTTGCDAAACVCEGSTEVPRCRVCLVLIDTGSICQFCARGPEPHLHHEGPEFIASACATLEDVVPYYDRPPDCECGWTPCPCRGSR